MDMHSHVLSDGNGDCRGKGFGTADGTGRGGGSGYGDGSACGSGNGHGVCSYEITAESPTILLE